MQVQALTFLADVELPDHEAFVRQLRVYIERFVNVFPHNVEDWDEEAVRLMVYSLRVDGFGHVGSRLLWDILGVPEAPDDFRARAAENIREIGLADLRAAGAEGGRSQERRRRVFSYAEYDLEPPRGEDPIQGRMLFENGFRDMRGDAKWLKHTPLPINHEVDRSLCCEIQMLTEFISQLRREGLAGTDELNQALEGRLLVFTTCPPCISCVGILYQFQLYFPAGKA